MRDQTDKSTLRTHIVPAAFSHGPVVFSRTLDSTNDTSKELANGGAVDGTAVICEDQSSGKGRQGREWIATPGLDLTFSLIVRELSDQMNLLPLAAALAVCESCDRFAGSTSRIKWPNDVWISESKVAGILVEARPRSDWAVVGIGLNINSTKENIPAEIRGQATSLLIETGYQVDREEVLRLLLGRLHEFVMALRAGRTADILHAYRSRDALIGRTIGWEADHVQNRGRAEGIDDAGNLLVSTAEGQLALKAGEVHLSEME